MSVTRPDIDVHPRTRTVETLSRDAWDVIILGGGPTGQTIAVRCADSQLAVLLVERELAGGECQNWACVPSKALLRPLEIAADAQAVGGTREKYNSNKTGSGGNIDLEGLWAYRDRTTSSWVDEGNVVGLGELGVTVVHGAGSLAGPQKVKITDWHSKKDVVVSARSVVIATGSEPFIPPVKGLAESRFWIPRDAVSARQVPDHLIILGGGLVGSEFATVYSQIGSRVTLITTNTRILPIVVEEAAKRVHQSLEKLGVDIRVGMETTEVRRDGARVTVTLMDGSTVEGTEILVAAGRRTRTTGMGLTALGVQEGSPVEVDEQMDAKAVADGWLYAIGDTNGIGNTTHMGMYEATICAQHILAGAGKQIVPGTDKATANLRDTIPQTCFTQPQVSWVGLSLSQAQARGIDAKEVSVETGGPGTHSYLYAEDYRGWAQWVVEAPTGKLLGAVFVGSGVANLLHASTVAIVGGMTWQQLLHAVPSFPTLSEAYNLLIQECLSTAW